MLYLESFVLSVFNPQPWFEYLVRVLGTEKQVLSTSSSGRWLVSATGNTAPSPDVVIFIHRTGGFSKMQITLSIDTNQKSVIAQ